MNMNRYIQSIAKIFTMKSMKVEKCSVPKGLYLHVLHDLHGKNFVIRAGIRFFLALALGLFVAPLFAAGTPASTTINNTAVVNYQVGGVPGTISDSVSFVVHEVLDVSVVWQDAANIGVLSPSSAQVLTFLVTNLGNGSEQFLLNAATALAGDDFDPQAAGLQIWIDADANDTLNTINDTLYTGANGPLLNGGTPGADAVTVFVTADIPAGRALDDLGNLRLTATSVAANTAGEVGNPGAEIAGAGDGGVNAHVGLSGAQDEILGVYAVSSTAVSIVKSVTVIGGNPVPGATLRYSLAVSVAGAVSVDNLLISDSIPANSTYSANSIVLNGVPQTDAADAPGVDYSEFNLISTAVSVDLSQGGTLSIAPPASFTITFEVTID
jgi:uncharacterized repeat protein (TIGR01451 family)